MGYYRVLFSQFPEAPNGDTQFIELEDKFGRSTGLGAWVDKGHHAELIIPDHPALVVMYEALREIERRTTSRWTRKLAQDGMASVDGRVA